MWELELSRLPPRRERVPSACRTCSQGNYEISASAKGFSTLVRKGITLTVGQELILNLSLQVGSVNEQVTVTAEAPTVNLANATISGVIEQRTVQELPLNGRSWTDLAILQPGVHQSQNQPPINAGDRVKRGLGLELTISGARPQQNNYLLDGVNINDYANAGPGSVLGGNLGTDAVAEFAVLTTNYSTEYGRTSGGSYHCNHQVRNQPVPWKRIRISSATARWMRASFYRQCE